MKSLGDQVREFRTHPSRGWSPAEMATRVGTSRQNIENLEKGSVELPSYLVQLADVMNISLDVLLNRGWRPDGSDNTNSNHGTYHVITLDDVLERLGIALAGVPDDMRPVVIDNMAGWARDRGSEHYRDVLALLLKRVPGKRFGAGG